MEKKAKTTGERIDEMTDKISEVASEIGEKFETGAEETKKVATGIKKWRETSSAEEITTTLLGLVLLILALWALRKFIGGVVLLLLGVLCVSGYFNPYLKELFAKFNKKADKPTKKAPEQVEKATTTKKADPKKPAKKTR